ncbi:two-component system sensor histidine kinase LiaS [Bacillus carboniphilus]|uniref:histidine kinase n=1 Tax=Bacillus carboniphilus TaxID=86663 RepID=A0ABN0VPN4_9BACI
MKESSKVVINQSVRGWLFQEFTRMAITVSLCIFVEIQLYLLISRNGKNFLIDSLWISLLAVITIFAFAFYYTFRSSTAMKKRADDLSTYVTQLRRGRWQERLDWKEENEFSIIADDLNALAEHIEEQVNTLQRLADEKSVLAQQAQTAAALEERQRLARDLHDSISQQLFALTMLSSAVLKGERTKEELVDSLTEISRISAQSQLEMRALLLHLRPVQLEGESLSDATIKLLRDIQKKFPIKCQASIDELPPLSQGLEEHLFRIIQEGISNILRHANATQLKCQLTERGENIYLYLGDNGKGFSVDTAKTGSYGLSTMKERCEEVGGIFTIRSLPEKGTYIEVTVPIKSVKRGEAVESD